MYDAFVLFSHINKDATITKERLITLTSFGAYYKVNSTSVGYILTAVIEQMTYMGPEETNLWNLSKSTVDTRREAGKALIKLCKSMSTHLLDHLEQLTSVVSNMFANNQLLMPEQIAALRALVALSNGIKKYDAQTSFLTTVLQPTTDDWVSPTVTGVISKMSSFLSFLGVNSTEPLFEVRKRSEKLTGYVHSTSRFSQFSVYSNRSL